MCFEYGFMVFTTTCMLIRHKSNFVKYIHSATALKYKFKLFILVYIVCPSTPLLHYILQGKVLFNTLHLLDSHSTAAYKI